MAMGRRQPIASDQTVQGDSNLLPFETQAEDSRMVSEHWSMSRWTRKQAEQRPWTKFWPAR